MLKSLFFSVHSRRGVGKIVGNKTYDVTVGELKNAGNMKLFWFQLYSDSEKKKLKMQSLHFQVHPGSKTFKENGL